MPSRYIASGVPEVSPGTISASDFQLPTFIAGSPEEGFSATVNPPRVGYWGITARTKQIHAVMQEPGNLATWVANALTPGDARFVSLGAANVMERQLGLDPNRVSGWDYVSNVASPIRNVAGIDARLMFDDDDFNADRASSQWLERNRDLAAAAARHGIDLPTQLAGARNRDHFVFLQNRALMQAQALQDIEQFEEQSYGITEFASMAQSAIQNYLLTDPTFLPSLLIPVGAPGRLAASTATSGSAVVRTLGAVGRAPAAMHGALATATSHRMAKAIELGIYGGAFNLGSQQGRMAQSRVIFDDPALQQEFSWAELGLVVGASALLGFGLAGKAASGRADGPEGVKRTMAAVVDSQGHRAEASPLVESIDFVRAQAVLDNAGVQMQRAAEILFPGRSFVLGEFLDDAVLSEAGMTRLDMEDLVVSMVEGFKGRTIDEGPAVAIMTSALGEARRVRVFAEEIDGMATQLERSAFSEALGRAGQELGNRGTPAQISTRAREILPGVLARLDERAQRIARGVGPQRADSAKFWQAEWADLARSADLRSLTRDELRYLMKVEGALKRLQADGVQVKFFSVFDELAKGQNRFDRPVLDLIPDSPLLRSLRETRRLRNEVELAAEAAMADGTIRATRKLLAEEIRRLRSLTGELVTEERMTLAEALKTTNEILAEALESGQGAAVRQGETLQKVLDDVAANPPTTPEARTKAYLRAIEARNLSDTMLIEDVGARNKVLFSWGLGKAIKRLIGSGAGMGETTRSTLDIIRMVAQEMDPNKLTVGDLSGRRVVKTLQTIRNDMEAASSEIVDEVSRLVSKGKFGSQLRVVQRRQKMAEFNREVIRHIQNIAVSQDEDVVRVANLWKKHAEVVRKAAEDIGEFKGLDDFFPRRFQLHRIAAAPAQFVNALGKHHLKFWQQTDELHLDTLASQLGGIERRGTKWFNEAGEEVAEGSLKRSDLPSLNITEEMYDGALVEGTKESARRTMSKLFGEDLYAESAEGGVQRIQSDNAPLPSRHREIDDSAWSSPEMEEFLDWNFLRTSHEYFRSTGVRVLNKQRHQQQWGIPGGSMDELLNAIEAARPTGLLPDEAVLWRNGVNNLREKLALAEGKLPSVRTSSDSVAEYLSEVGQTASTAIFGAGIGQAVLTTEMLQTLLRGIYSPRDIVRKAGNVLRVAARTGETKQLMQTMGLTVRQFRYHSMERFSAGSVDMDSFQFGLIPKVLNPFIDVFSSKGATLPGQGNRVAGALRAVGGLNMTVGGMDYFTQFARVLQVMDAQTEAGRFMKAAGKMGDLLAEQGEELQRIRQTQGEAAYFKKWRGLARKAGFGSQWQVAEKFARAGLLDPARMAALQRGGTATNGIRPGRIADIHTLMTHVPDAADAGLYDEAVKGLRDVMLGTMTKRISEQTLLQTPTSPNARSAWGQLVNTMTGFARSWSDSNILDAAQMPTRTAAALLAVYLFGETFNRMSREIAMGRDIDEIMQDIEEDPDNFIARTITNVPFAGQWTYLIRNGLEAVTRDDRMMTSDPGSSAGFGAVAAVQDTILNGVQAVSPLTGEEPEIRSNTVRTAGRLLPVYNAWWFGALNDVSSARLGTTDLRAPIKRDQGRTRSYRPQSFSAPTFTDLIDTGPDFGPVDFQLPEILP